MTIRHLSDHPDASDPEPFTGPDHPMRKVTRQVAFDGLWDAARAARVGALFDGMAAEWALASDDPIKTAPIRDALDRGNPNRTGRWLELGAGTGAGTRVIAPEVDSLVAVDLAGEMLANAPADLAPRVRADASRLPFPDHCFDGILLVNMLLFPSETVRILRDGGQVLWVNSLGDQTPIHLPPDEVAEVLPGTWSGVSARAGTGFWVMLEPTGP